MTAKKSTKTPKKGPSKAPAKKPAPVKAKERKIGIDVPMPKKPCEGDKNCPFHGELTLRGRILSGTVIKAKMPKYALVESVRKKFMPKYERYERRRTRISAHNPLCIGAKEGDKVKMAESRKLSKTKSFVIIEVMEK